jgi:hypothetical protein
MFLLATDGNFDDCLLGKRSCELDFD